MLIATSAANLVAELDVKRRQGGARQCVSLVIAGGNLHAGHEALITAARSLSDVVVVGITPNSQRDHSNVVSAGQFQDIAFIEQAEVDFLYTPSDQDALHVQMPGVFSLRLPAGYPICGSKKLMAQSLALQLRFINTVQPDVVVCGERNYVEYRLLRQLVSDFAIRAQIQCIPTVRDTDGLALCANNVKLKGSERAQAPVLYQTLNNVAHAIRTGARNFDKLEKTARLALKGAGFHIESFAVYDDATLSAPSEETEAFRIMGNTQLGSHYLHDSLGLSL
jgi:pantoate--beta-alanine ligase